MSNKRAKKREDLRSRLIGAARQQIADHGLSSLRARDVAAQAGCALGAIYTVFEDLDDLILHANAPTLEALGRDLASAAQAPSPAEALEAMALAYARFARQNRNLWDALFDHRMAHGGASPGWFLSGHSKLLALLTSPLSQLEPTLPPAGINLRARTYFAAIHGIVSISLQGRFLGIPANQLDAELTAFTAKITGS